MKLSIIVIVATLVVGGIVAVSGFFTNQEIADIPKISDKYANLEKYKNELEKINQYNQQVLKDLENQIKNSDSKQLEQLNEEIRVVKRVINDNKAELEQVIQKLSAMESNP
jgi:predicted PurR-regulated permease PerM